MWDVHHVPTLQSVCFRLYVQKTATDHFKLYLCSFRQASDDLFELFQVKIISDMEYRHIVFRPHCKFLNTVCVK
jgi:hypothetical protein